MAKVAIDESCIGCGLCESMAPEIFSMGDDGLAHPIKETVDGDEVEKAKEAAESCPTQSITVE